MSNFTPKPFGEYYLLDRVAVGGMAEIFKAKTYGVGGFEKLLAIKRILPHHAQNQDFIRMLIDEAKIAVALNHVNIVQVYDLGKIDNDYFIAMEFVDGRDLRTVFRKCKQMNIPLAMENAVYIILEICKGLDYAHRKTDRAGVPLSVVHRDISPQNILISFEGEVKIVDFGIAKAANKVVETESGILKGKFSYMSPEQARGLSLDRRTDIFSTGIIMYELLTGEKLFKGKGHLDILEKIKKFQLDPPFLPQDVPSELEFILSHALEPSLDDRYEYASDFQIELTKFLYSSSLDFTARNLSDLMRRLFQDERREEHSKEFSVVEPDDATRSVLLNSHAESLVSKTDLSIAENNEETQPQIREPKTLENETIVKKFQQAISAQNKPAPQTQSLDVGQPPGYIFTPRNTPPAPPKIRDTREEETLPHPEEEKLAGSDAWNRSFEKMTSVIEEIRRLPPSRQIALVTAVLSVVLIFIALAIWVAKPAPKQAVNPPAPITATLPEKKKPKETVYLGDIQNKVDFSLGSKPEKSATAIFVTTPPGATVFTAERKPLGLTPLEIFNIPADQRLLFQIQLKDFIEHESIFALEADTTKVIEVKLEPNFGAIEVNSTPEDAKVYLNKNYIGQTPLRFDKVLPNIPVIIALSKDGFEDKTVPFRIGPGESRVFNSILEKAQFQVSISSKPAGAAIFLNGVQVGMTPKKLTDLTPNTEYVLVVRSDGYRDWVRKFKVNNGENSELFAQLEQSKGKLGSLYLESDPPGATVLIDGNATNLKTPCVIDRLVAGRMLNIKLQKENFDTAEATVEVSADEVTNQKIRLNRQIGRLTVKSFPPNAEVYINNRLVGETPLSYYALEAGKPYILELKKPGYQNLVRSVSLRARENSTLNISLQAQ